MEIERNEIVTLFDIFSKINIFKYIDNKRIRYQAKIELTIPIIVRKEIVEELRFWKINAFISRNTIIISGNKNIDTFITQYGYSFKYNYKKINVLRNFINYRLERNKQRYSIIDDGYYLHLTVLNKQSK
jgi:hypothetical protein